MRVRGVLRPWFMVALLGLAGCGPAPVYQVRRSALVMHPTPPLRTGAPMSEPVEIAARASTVLMPIAPHEARDANADLHVARHNLSTSVRFRVSARGDLGLLFETGLQPGSMAIAEDSLALPDVGAVSGAGVTMQYAVELNQRVSLGIAFDGLLVAVPYREVLRCVENCEGISDFDRDATELTPVGRLALLPSYRERNVTAYGGVTLVNHPVAARRQVLDTWSADISDRIDPGPLYTLLSAGLDYRATPVLHLFTEGFIPVSRSVASYGPSIGFGVRLSLR
ncbi:MAG: hypothetical protein IT370_22990 [Deltaproteobacteria bacterium]|nr:hypothetical protein [Deltaproteobacteria bacterium]